MEKMLKLILEKLDKLDKLDKLEKLEERIERLERLEPLVVESHQWIQVLLENKEIQRAEMDHLKNDLSKVEGVLHGFDKSLEPIRKAQ